MKKDILLQSTALTLAVGALSSVWSFPTYVSAQVVESESHAYDSLGRLILTETSGGINNGETRSLCYDGAGNRVRFRSASDGTTITCVSPPPSSPPPPPPPPTPPPPPPPPSNYPPVTNADSVGGECFTSVPVNLTVNDSDPEGNYPLSLVSIAKQSGSSGASISSASSVNVLFGRHGDVTTFTYVVQDSLGATSNGTLTVTAAPCDGIPTD